MASAPASSTAAGHRDLWPQVSEWVEERRREGTSANDVLEALGLHLFAADQDEETRWVLAALAATQWKERAQPRQQLPSVDSLTHAVELLRNCKRALVLSGPGVSTAMSGFQAFWDGLEEEARGSLPDALALFDGGRFVYAPHVFLEYMCSIMFGEHAPSLSHRFIRELEKRSQLQRNYSQNIDALEQAAGIERVVHCFGSVALASCLACRTSEPCARVHDALQAGRIPRCAKCSHELNILRPDVAFFGDERSDDVELALRADLPRCDLLVVIGSELTTDPLHSVPSSVPHDVPQLLISPCVPASTHAYDLELIGDCDAIVGYLSEQLGWDLSAAAGHARAGPPAAANGVVGQPTFVAPNRYVFGGAAASGNVAGGGSNSLDKVAQTPLATAARAERTSKGIKRGSSWLVGATSAGSGVGARASLSAVASMSEPPAAATSTEGMKASPAGRRASPKGGRGSATKAATAGEAGNS